LVHILRFLEHIIAYLCIYFTFFRAYFAFPCLLRSVELAKLALEVGRFFVLSIFMMFSAKIEKSVCAAKPRYNAIQGTRPKVPYMRD